MERLQQHPLGQALPKMSWEDYERLRTSLHNQGLLVPIVRHEGMILDGWNRYNLCLEEGVDPEFEDYDGSDPMGIVLALNVWRRHLSYEQKLKAAEDLVRAFPSRTNRQIAKDTQLEHHTIAKVREKIEGKSTVDTSNGDDPYYVTDGCDAPQPEAEHAAELPKPRLEEGSKRLARGRKPLSPEQKAARAKEAAKAEKEHKPLTSARDDKVNTLAEVIAANLGQLDDIVRIISGYEGEIQRRFSLWQRNEMARRFAKILGVIVDLAA